MHHEPHQLLRPLAVLLASQLVAVQVLVRVIEQQIADAPQGGIAGKELGVAENGHGVDDVQRCGSGSDRVEEDAGLRQVRPDLL